MDKLLTFFTYLSALLSLAPFLRPGDQAARVLLWPFKLLAGALAPILGLAGGLGAVLGLFRRDWKLVGAGTIGAGLAARFVRDVDQARGDFAAAFGPNWQRRVPPAVALPPQPWPWPRPAGEAVWRRDIPYGPEPAPGQPQPGPVRRDWRLHKRLRGGSGAMLADVWQPQRGVSRTGLGVVHVHGGGWRVGDKDMGTRPFFRRLAGQGHVVMDVAHTLWPTAGIPTMVAEVKQAVLWLKENAAAYGVDPERIVLMGGSAGGHLALMAAYTAGQAAPDAEAFQPSAGAGDASVCGVVALYPPTDLLAMREVHGAGDRHGQGGKPPSLVERPADAMLDWIFAFGDEDLAPESASHQLLPMILGGEADEIPETYRLLSPSNHVGAHCPPTLLLQGSDDVFLLAPMVRRLHKDLRRAGVPSVLVEFPHTEHAFDLVLPRISPAARAAAHNVERFLALLA